MATTANRSRLPGRLARALRGLGPGFVTGASDDDPSGIGTYAVAGASLGYTTLWLAPFCVPLMACVQFLCAKIALVCGQGLAGVLRERYPRPVLYGAVAALLIANTINAGADLGAIAEAIHLLVPVPAIWLIAPVAFAILAIEIFGTLRQIERIFKWLTLALLAYIASSFYAHPDWGAVARASLLPRLSWTPEFLSTLVAILGTTISPYLFFWQSDQEVETEIEEGREELLHRRGETSRTVLRHAAWDTVIGMVFSNLVMYFIILGTAATLHAAGNTHISSAAEAAEALRPIAGQAASALLALGLIGSGFLAVPVLTASAAYALSVALGWPSGLDKRFAQARRFYGVIVAATLVGMGLNFLGVNPIAALFWTAVLNGFAAPPLLVLIMLVSGDRAVMGAHAAGPLLKGLGWLTTAVMGLAALALVLTWGR
jgi:NRAMP (natural resistance-associated macrophage protein)-like metal ion transporter